MDIITISLGSILTFECDPKKSVANLQKHGIDFDEAQQLWEGIYIKAPARKRGERRYAVVGVLRGVHWTAIATDRGDRIRIISLEPAGCGMRGGSAALAFPIRRCASRRALRAL